MADAGQNLYGDVDLVEKGGNHGGNAKGASTVWIPKIRKSPPELVRGLRPRGRGS